MSRYQPVINSAKVEVVVYDNVSACENLTLYNMNSIIPTFLHFLFSLNAMSVEAANKKFHAINFTVAQQPPHEQQDANYDEALPFVFLYICSLIPKNPTESLTRHLSKKEIGLMRYYEELNLLPTAGNYILPNDALEVLQKFINRHSDLMTFTYETFLGIANPEARHIAYAYSYELLPSLDYANMNSVMIIEEFLVAEQHPCLVDAAIAGSLIEYNKFKRSAKNLHGVNWKMMALLRKDLWSVFSRTHAHKRLRIIATMFASEEVHTFDGIFIDEISIASYKSQPYYSRIFNAYGSTRQKFHQVPNNIYGRREVELIMNRANRYVDKDNYGDADSDEEGRSGSRASRTNESS